MKNQKGVSMITLIITIIVIIILAAIAFIGINATDRASYSGFAQEFSDFALNFQNDPYGDVLLKYGTMGKSITSAQANYLAANKANAIADNTIIPAGLEFVTQLKANTSTGASKALLDESGTDVTKTYWGEVSNGATYSTNTDIACWVIDDSQVEGYKANHKFYGDNLGTETHYVTQNGFVFTLPGFPREVDGQYRMYIAPDVYYVVDQNYTDVVNATESTPVYSHVSEGAESVATNPVVGEGEGEGD